MPCGTGCDINHFYEQKIESAKYVWKKTTLQISDGLEILLEPLFYLKFLVY